MFMFSRQGFCLVALDGAVRPTIFNLGFLRLSIVAKADFVHLFAAVISRWTLTQQTGAAPVICW